MDRTLFEAVRQKSLAQWSHRTILRNKSDHLLTGLLFDDAGHRMIPTHATKSGIRYRYYVSTPFLHGEAKTASAGSISRVPAAGIEDTVVKSLDAHLVGKQDGSTSSGPCRWLRGLTEPAGRIGGVERNGHWFVSVTQQFNTTTSMGRLTLNVLLSFAQFEREVTSERIRDKIAASKRKGLWVGGTLPLGYHMKDDQIAVVEDEAERVRLIYRRYLELGPSRGRDNRLQHCCYEHFSNAIRSCPNMAVFRNSGAAPLPASDRPSRNPCRRGMTART
jgi:resolvase-like protein